MPVISMTARSLLKEHRRRDDWRERQASAVLFAASSEISGGPEFTG
ncbi:hypothetical protein [Bradyrhizobium sp.]|jgi:hypothetical protein